MNTAALKTSIENALLGMLEKDSNLDNGKLKLLLQVEFFEQKGSAKLITEVLKDRGLIITKSEGRKFNLYYYEEFLTTRLRTVQEFESLMKGASTYGKVPENVIRKRASYKRSFDLARSIHAYRDKQEADKTPLTEAEQKIKDAFDFLKEGKAKKAKGAKLNKGQYHPDKVFSLKDEKLTAAYTAFFQSLNK